MAGWDFRARSSMEGNAPPQWENIHRMFVKFTKL